MQTIRPAAVAGTFYPAQADTLQTTVSDLLAKAQTPDFFAPVVMAPHAGYLYSGPTAAAAYKAINPQTKRVVIFGPTHRVGIRGMALAGADAFSTPLGTIPADAEISAALEELPDVVSAPHVHAQEHSIEVHLPFLQEHLSGPFTVVPVAVGQAAPAAVATAIERALSFPDTAVIISSDLSHYLPDEEARQRDALTVQQICEGAPALTSFQACGVYPVSGMMAYARTRGLIPTVLDVTNSSDTAGKADSVVGYASMAWTPSGQRDDQRLPNLARQAIAAQLEGKSHPVLPKSSDKDLQGLGASFVTLTINGRLRGCIGTLRAYRPLYEDVVTNARAAAFMDERFPPLSHAELEEVDIEVSQLSVPCGLGDHETPGSGSGLSEDQVADTLEPGRDGVVITYEDHRATFLPRVWDQLPDPRDFLANLKVKAGLAPNFWSPDILVETYRVETFHLDKGAQNAL